MAKTIPELTPLAATPAVDDLMIIYDTSSGTTRSITAAYLATFSVSDTAYNATSWDDVDTIAPSKNAVRDKFVSVDTAIASEAKATLTTTGDLLYASAANTLARLAKSTEGKVLKMGASLPEWADDAGGFYNAYLKYSDTKATTTDGGGSTATTWQVRTLNTEDHDTASIGTLSSNQVTLPAGTYYAVLNCPGYDINRQKARIWNDTGSAVLVQGGTWTALFTGADSGATAMASGLFTLSVESAIEAQHWTETAKASTGLGFATDDGGDEIYTTLEIWRLN